MSTVSPAGNWKVVTNFCSWPTTAVLAMQRIELLSKLFNHCTALRRRDRWEEIQQQFPELALKCSRGMGRESVS